MMTMPNTKKNSYNKEHDNVILKALEKSPDNRNEAFRMAERELTEKFDMNVNANQISSRFYTFIKPKYLDRKVEPANHIVASAGSGFKEEGTSGQYKMVRELALQLDSKELIRLVKEIFLHIE